VIRVENLRITYPGGTKALLRTYICFRPNEFTVLVGPSGAGKSTLLKSLNLLVTPSTGKITTDRLGEITNHKLIREHRRQTGMIFQQHQLIGRYTALDNVLMGRIGHYGAMRSLFPLPQKDQVLALACLQRVGLGRKALERVDRLSGGEQQRVGIARALAQRPKVILADEPVASLDPATAADVLSLLKQIGKEEQITLVVSLHQIEWARRYADRVIGLSQGSIVFDGAPGGLTTAVLQNIYNKNIKPAEDVNVAPQERQFGLPALWPMRQS
jgi:phosphonate transport system ATP-binding protein